MGKFKDITGNKYGRLTALSREGKRGPNYTWLCACDCGKQVVLPAIYFTTGNTSSCGCLKRETNIRTFTKHGCAGNREAVGRTREYRIWLMMKNRCINPKSNTWERYGGRGIKVCDRWRESFGSFIEDMGPSNGLTIDRINNDGDYEPANCRWATMSEQAYNRRLRHPITFKGETKSITAWARAVGLSSNVVTCRLRMGWSVERALTVPKRPRRSKRSSLPEVENQPTPPQGT